MRRAPLLALMLALGCGGGESAAPTAPGPAPEQVTPAPPPPPPPLVAPAPEVAPAVEVDVPTITALPDPSSIPDTPTGLENGDFAPDLTRPDLRGGATWALSAHVGPNAPADSPTKVVIVGMVASWCGPCAASLPLLKELRAEYGEALQIALVATDVTPEGRLKEAEKVTAAGLDAVVLDPSEIDLRAWMGQRRNVPHFYIINRVGEILVQDRGFGNKVRRVLPKQVAYAAAHPEYVSRKPAARPAPGSPPTPAPG